MLTKIMKILEHFKESLYKTSVIHCLKINCNVLGNSIVHFDKNADLDHFRINYAKIRMSIRNKIYENT